MKSGGSKLTFLTLVFLVQPSSALHSETGKRKGIGFVASVPCKIAILQGFGCRNSHLFFCWFFPIYYLPLQNYSLVPVFSRTSLYACSKRHRSPHASKLSCASAFSYIVLSICLSFFLSETCFFLAFPRSCTGSRILQSLAGIAVLVLHLARFSRSPFCVDIFGYFPGDF